MTGGYGGNGFGKATATAGTKIVRGVPPLRGAYLRVTKLLVTAGTTAHTLTALRSLGVTTLSAAAAAGQPVVNLTADPGAAIGNAIAANDWLAIRRAVDGITRFYQVSSVSALAITLTANLAAGLGLASQDKVWFLGVETDTDPRTGEAHPAFAVPASAQQLYADTEGGVVATIGTDEPVFLIDNNATAAGSIDQTSYVYTNQ